MFRRFLLCLALCSFWTAAAQGAFLENLKTHIVQPNGDTLQCLISGDEFYQRYHDVNDYTIIRDPQTRYWVYAEFSGGELRPTSYIFGQADPTATSLIPGVGISREDYLAIYEEYFGGRNIVLAPNTGTINNICIFIRFSDQTEFDIPRSFFDSLFNDSSPNTSSLYNYFDETSYNQLAINTHFYPISGMNENLSFQDTLPKAYYQPYDPIDNPIGYDGNEEKAIREHTLLRGAIEGVSPEIPIDLDIDGDLDGFVDAVCFIVRDTTDSWNTLLWPHRWMLYSFDVYIRGLQVYDYAFELEKKSDVSVFCHETFHVLGSPDLYHYYGIYTSNHPIGHWGLMDQNPDPPGHMGAYMKYQYGGWIDSIPRIMVPGTYTLNPITSNSNNAYMIPCPSKSNEYFVVEYRNRSSSIFENSLPGSGLLIYRINIDMAPYGNRYGPPDEVYIYRPGGEYWTYGDPDLANFSSEAFRTEFNETTDPFCWMSDSTLGGISISDIGSAGNTISFHLDANAHFLSGPVYDDHIGPLSPNWEPYIVTTEVVVPDGETLTIMPGTTLQFLPGTKIVANGTLFANGSTSPIRCIMYDDTTDVRTIINSGMRLQNGGTLSIPE